MPFLVEELEKRQEEYKAKMLAQAIEEISEKLDACLLDGSNYILLELHPLLLAEIQSVYAEYGWRVTQEQTPDDDTYSPEWILSVHATERS